MKLTFSLIRCNYSPQKNYKKLTLPTVYRNSNVIEF